MNAASYISTIFVSVFIFLEGNPETCFTRINSKKTTTTKGLSKGKQTFTNNNLKAVFKKHYEL